MVGAVLIIAVLSWLDRDLAIRWIVSGLVIGVFLLRLLYHPRVGIVSQRERRWWDARQREWSSVADDADRHTRRGSTGRAAVWRGGAGRRWWWGTGRGR